MKTMQSQIQIAIEGIKEFGRHQLTQTKKAKANQTRKVAQGKDHHKNKNITRKLRSFFFLQTIYYFVLQMYIQKGRL
jgi:hypothetical protein